MGDFSWQTVHNHPSVPDGVYADAIFNQHSVGWCGCCYIVAVVQTIEDRGHIARPREARHRIDMQTVVDHFNTSASSDDSQWNACHGGYPLHVVECLMSKVCPMVTSRRPKRWLGHPSRTHHTPLSTVPYTITRVKRMQHVKEEIYARGPVVLEINAQTLKSVDREGIVTNLQPDLPNHAVSVVGWRHTSRAGPCWIVRNSWGQHRVPKAVPDDVMCVDEDGNRCEVEWEYWIGDPILPGFCYIPMSHPMFHAASDPWIVPFVE